MKNLCDIEELSASFADGIIIIHDSISTGAELATFASNALLQSKICVLEPDSTGIEERKISSFLELAFFNESSDIKRIVYYPEVYPYYISKTHIEKRTNFSGNKITCKLSKKIDSFLGECKKEIDIKFEKMRYGRVNSNPDIISYNIECGNLNVYISGQILLYKELSKKNNVSLNSCSRLVELCSVGDKGLPLGLITSPILSNIYMKEFDNILYGKLKKLNLENIIYTRYADDIAISYKSNSYLQEDIEKIKKLVYERLDRIGLKSNDKKERVFSIRKGGHVRITGINITRDDDNYRRLSVGRKRKDELYNSAVEYVKSGCLNQQEALRIKGYEAFVLAVEGKNYEKSFSEKMLHFLETLGYKSLHDLIADIKY